MVQAVQQQSKWLQLDTLFGNKKRAQLAPDVRDALQTAYRLFQEVYPEWIDTLFDWEFLTKDAAALFADEQLPTPDELTTAWLNHCQLPVDSEIVLPIVVDFMSVVYIEMVGIRSISA